MEAIHNLKLFALGPDQGHVSGITESHAEFVHHSVELRFGLAGPSWKYSTVKRLVFSQPSRRPFPIGYWATVPVRPGDTKNMSWGVSLRSSSKDISLNHTVEKHTPSCLEARVRLNPPADENDYIEYVTRAESPYLNPVWEEDLAEDATPIHLDDGAYLCYDGSMFIHRTKKAILQFRFAVESGLRKFDLRPFVGSYTSTIDYEVPSELKRMDIRFGDFGDSVSVRIEIDSPLPGHMYGVAWNAKSNPDRRIARAQVNQPGASDYTDSLVIDNG